MPRTPLVLATLVLAALACGETTAPSPDRLEVHTDRAHYAPGTTGELRIRTRAVVTLDECDLRLERREGTDWVPLAPAAAVAPDAVVLCDRLFLPADTTVAWHLAIPAASVAGTYRVLLGERVASNTFTVGEP